MDFLFNLRSVDLNLLVFFDALMTELHVTRAANKIAISQSAMSSALARLRHVFQDDLFIRTAKGMEPTPRAIELGPLVREILQQTTRLAPLTHPLSRSSQRPTQNKNAHSN